MIALFFNKILKLPFFLISKKKSVLSFLFLVFALQTSIAQNRSFSPNPTGERRIALVIGNKDYTGVSKLRNPINDAIDMTNSLKRLGFEVFTLKNADYRTFIDSLNIFTSQLRSSDVVLFYYSGHGVSYNNINYLLPTDTKIRCLEQIESSGISLNRILVDIASKSVKNSFVFLDACRDFPHLMSCDASKRNITAPTGLVRPTNNPQGSMVVYATREGSTADDNINERNGMFTGTLLKYIEIPNIGIRSILDSTTAGVRTKTNYRQSPGRYDELEGDFYFLKTRTVISYDDVNKSIQEGEAAFEQKQYDDAFRYYFPHKEHTLFKSFNQGQLGFMYDMGFGVRQDYSEAMKWYLKAAEKGDARAEYNLGIFYERGLSNRQDYKKAVEWYLKAAEHHLADAQFNLGFLYEKGLGVTQNYREATEWYRKAAEQGDADAQVNLGFIYETAQGLPQDLKEAVKWYKKASDQGDAEGSYNFARLASNSLSSQELINLYTQAAKQGHIEAQLNLGYIYETSKGTLQNTSQAINWYQKAANQGHPIAQFNLAVMYDATKNGSNQNYDEAINWYQKAAKQGLPLAYYNLGIIYEYGKGVSKNSSLAKDYYKKAAKLGNDSAQKALGRFGMTW